MLIIFNQKVYLFDLSDINKRTVFLQLIIRKNV